MKIDERKRNDRNNCRRRQEEAEKNQDQWRGYSDWNGGDLIKNFPNFSKNSDSLESRSLKGKKSPGSQKKEDEDEELTGIVLRKKREKRRRK